MFADLNGLKTVNDSGGHTARDILLKDAADALQQLFDVREIFRAGGDEFVVILTGISEETLAEKTQKLREIAESYDHLNFAVGTAFDPDSVNVRKALRTADERMYADKNRYYELHPEKKRSAAR
jgi:diguanylate cyclase (GGDEF)-like protein